MPRLLTLALMLFYVSIKTSANAAETATSCELLNPQTLEITGYIRKNLLPCVEALDLSDLTTLRVNSTGGSVRTAIAVGDIIARPNLHIIVDEVCGSSCANYWVPLAAKLTLKPGAFVGIHGSIDKGLIEKSLREPEQLARIKQTAQLQNQYAERHGIPRGWLLYRTDYFAAVNARYPYLTGRADIHPKTKSIKFYYVEERMLESCLPHIEIIGYENSYVATRTITQKHLQAKKGNVFTGSWECTVPIETKAE